MLHYDFGTELSGIYDMDMTVSSLTSNCIIFSGILVLAALIAVFVLARKYTGIKLLPIVYGVMVYFLFYRSLGSFIGNIIIGIASIQNAMITKILILLINSAVIACLIVGGRFFSMWFLKRYYSSFGDAYGIGIGFSVVEGVSNIITIFLNYCLCVTINQAGLRAFANTFETLEEATQQVEALISFYQNPWYLYILSAIEIGILMFFHTMISGIFYSVQKNEVSKKYIGILIGMYTAISFPAMLMSLDIVNELTGMFLMVLVFAASAYCFVNHYKTYHSDIDLPKTKPLFTRKTNQTPNAKMPKFNDKINKI